MQRLVVLNANTDRSRFAQAHPRDGEKFRTLIQEVRPGWEVLDFDVTSDEYPPSWQDIDGVIITGSPASATEDHTWFLALLNVICQLDEMKMPMFGVCFGHQAIARALGGKVEANSGPFILGIVEAQVSNPPPWMQNAPKSFRIAAAHGDQVSAIPAEAVVNCSGPDCPVGGYHIGDHVFASEYHPEMTQHFIESLTDAMARNSDPAVIERARASFFAPADRALFANWIAAFFEHNKSPC